MIEKVGFGDSLGPMSASDDMNCHEWCKEDCNAHNTYAIDATCYLSDA